MLAIRMQRVGRKGHAQFRMIVQDGRFHPTSGRVVAYLGNYDPHSKQSNFDKEKLQAFLANGAQPSPRVIKLLKSQKVKLPEWVKEPTPMKKAVRNPDKRRSTRPEGVPEPEAKAAAETETPVETTKKAAVQPAPTSGESESRPESVGAEKSKAEAESEPIEEAPAIESQPEPSATPEKPAE